jgi:hypothetical protein
VYAVGDHSVAQIAMIYFDVTQGLITLTIMETLVSINVSVVMKVCVIYVPS